MATTLTLDKPQALGHTQAPEPKVVPFVGGDVFNPADWIRVTNMDELSTFGKGAKLRKEIRGRFNGKDYVFPYGEPVNVHVEVAKHLFGLGSDDKSAAFARLGWAKSSDELTEAMERIINIKFDDLPELMEQARFKSPDVAHASGLVKGDGTEGAGKLAPKDPTAGR
jgi:hypothetical protein